MAFTLLDQGSFTSAGVGMRIAVPGNANYFRVHNLTQAATTQATGRGIVFEWYRDLTASAAQLRTFKDNAGNGLNQTSDSSGGFTFVESFPAPEAQAANAITGITQADPAVVSQTNSYSNGDWLVLYNTTGMLQIAGMVFQISSVSGAGYSLIGLDASGFASAGSAGNTRRVSPFDPVSPGSLFVTSVSQASSAVVRTSVDPSQFYVVGMKVHFSIPSSYGMVELDQMEGTITAVSSAAYTLTVDINSSAFSAFAFPTSASVPSSRQFATLAPAGQAPGFYNVSEAPFHPSQSFPYMWLPAGVQSPAGSSGDVIVYQAWKAEN